jgi:hypothetical protein
MDIGHLALAVGASLGAGLNLYITVVTLGLLDRFDLLTLPQNLEVLSNPWVLGTAGLLAVVEFVADKVPYIDNAWDTIHTFIRIPAGAVLASAAFVDVPSQTLWIAALLGGFISFTAHGAKASARLAVNATPEPFSNWFLSLAEDVLSFVVLWLVASHPYLALGLSGVLIVLFLLVIYLFYRFFKLIFRSRLFFRKEKPEVA